VRRVGEAGEDRVGEDGEAEGAAAAEPIAQAPEEAATQGPPGEERRLDPRALLAHGGVGGAGGGEQLHHEGRGDERVEVHVQAVEQPAQPGRDAGLSLRGGQVAQAPSLVHRA
jgi:hypothetical protein